MKPWLARSPNPPSPAPDEGRVAIKRGGYIVAQEPGEIFARHMKIPLSPLEFCIFELLIKKGRATLESVEAELEARGGNPRNVNILLHRIRRKFGEAIGLDPVETIRGWGFRLRELPDENNSTSLMIGGRVYF